MRHSAFEKSEEKRSTFDRPDSPKKRQDTRRMDNHAEYKRKRMADDVSGDLIFSERNRYVKSKDNFSKSRGHKPYRSSETAAQVRKNMTEKKPDRNLSGNKTDMNPRDGQNGTVVIPDVRFAELLSEIAIQRGYLEVVDTLNNSDFLACMDYGLEKELKLIAVRRYWKLCGLPSEKIDSIIASPKPRNYRTTSKRKVLWKNGQCVFSMGYSTDSNRKGCFRETLQSPLEAEIHGKLYSEIYEILQKPHFEVLVKSLNFCIIRGTYKKAYVILNVFHANGQIVRKIKLFTEELIKIDSNVVSVFMYLDESRSDYYLDTSKNNGNNAVKKIYGQELLSVTVNGMKLRYPITAFSQVNESMIPLFTQTAFELLRPTKKTRLLDLYSGYGLFSFTFAESVKNTIAMDLEGPSISAGIENAKYIYPEKNMKFIASAITAESVMSSLPEDEALEEIILDPPRNGTSNGVIQAISERKASKVLHVFCSVDQIPQEVKIWLSNGYQISSVKILDMFPGSPNLETMVLLEPVNPEKKRKFSFDFESDFPQ